ncbi:MAG: thioredoxin domain-containing protein, partial [Chloroflexota bacterium]
MNYLQNETSPYLLQHADNPVDWYPWGEEAFAKAQTEDKPILLSVGYSACHWCHVMAHESFEHEPTAKIMNEWFVNVKVDREERPDVDDIYMQAVQAMNRGQGGWPMTVFMLPDGRPFFGGTYFPRESRQGMPSFRRVMQAVYDAYTDRREEIEEQAESLADALDRSVLNLPTDDSGLNETIFIKASNGLNSNFDSQHGGFGGAPKFPNPMNL